MATTHTSQGRWADPESELFLKMALSSARDLECFLLLSRDTGVMDGRTHDGLTSTVENLKRVLMVLANELRREI